MTDLELLKKIKIDNDFQARNELWERYQGKVHSSFFKNQRFFREIGLTFEDYRQDAFFAFIDCIDYINLEKMEDSNSSFGTSFYFYLLKIKNKNQREVAKMGIPIYLSQLDVKNEIDESSSGLKKAFNSKTAVEFSDELENRTVREIVQDYINEQPTVKKQILQMYLEDVSVRDIAENLKINYMKVYKFIRASKDALTTIYSNAMA
jgi:DNA-directed RNA polymerase specialized sigma24 family protein